MQSLGRECLSLLVKIKRDNRKRDGNFILNLLFIIVRVFYFFFFFFLLLPPHLPPTSSTNITPTTSAPSALRSSSSTSSTSSDSRDPPSYAHEYDRDALLPKVPKLYWLQITFVLLLIPTLLYDITQHQELQQLASVSKVYQSSHAFDN